MNLKSDGEIPFMRTYTWKELSLAFGNSFIHPSNEDSWGLSLLGQALN